MALVVPPKTQIRVICHVTASCKLEGRRLVVLSVILFIPTSMETSKVVKSRTGDPHTARDGLRALFLLSQ